MRVVVIGETHVSYVHVHTVCTYKYIHTESITKELYSLFFSLALSKLENHNRFF